MTNGDGRHRGFIEALPFLAMLAGVAALVALLICLFVLIGR